MKKGIHGYFSGVRWKRIIRALGLQEGRKDPKYLGSNKNYILPLTIKPYPRYHIRAELSKTSYRRGKKVAIFIHIDWKKHTESTDKDPLINELIKKMIAIK